MSNLHRFGPEAFLEAARREEEHDNRGSLKIFLGMAAGVGKTFTMLEEAQQLNRDGIDIVIGTVNTHGRAETASLLEGLTIIPEATMTYHGKEFKELDLDALLKLKPQLVVVDELAHSNIAGSRHAKRWQDVMELLEHGIDVYTTLNVQHIESLNDVVEEITGIAVRETVPDLMIERAAFVHLVDLSPEELLQRLREGKVYLGDQSRVAALNFFQKDRLTALREIVLRFTAEKVDRDLLSMAPTAEGPSGWKPRERLMVAVGPSPHAQKLIRTTRRLAFRLGAPWIAVYVNTGQELNEDNHNLLTKNLNLARDLGAEVITANDTEIVDGLARIARQKGVTQILIGRSPPRTFFNFFRSPSVVNELSKKCTEMDVHIVRQEKPLRKPLFWPPIEFFKRRANIYLLTFIAIALLTGLNLLIEPFIRYKVLGFFYLLIILLLNLAFTNIPIFFASVLSTLAWDYFFIPPKGVLLRYDFDDSVLVISFLLITFATGVLVKRARVQKELLSKREEWTQALYDIVREIASAPISREIIPVVEKRLQKMLHGKFSVLIKKKDNGLDVSSNALLDDAKEQSAAHWVFENGKEAGWSTSTLPASKNLYIPLRGFQEMVGVLAYQPDVYRALNTEQKNFIYTVGQQLANFVERTFLEERKRELESYDLEEGIYQNVLKSISEEFQHPLANIQDAIYATVEALKHEQEMPAGKSVEKQIQRIETSSKGLFNMLDTVSVMAKLSGRLIPVNKEPHSIVEVVQATIERMRKKMEDRKLLLHIEKDLPLIPYDFSLLEVLLGNLLQNAIDYSPPNSTIQVDVEKTNGSIAISIADEGKGIPCDMLDLIFEKFYRLPGTTSPGMGLGLAIAKRIADIHMGELIAGNRPVQGAKFTLFLPTFQVK